MIRISLDRPRSETPFPIAQWKKDNLDLLVFREGSRHARVGTVSANVQIALVWLVQKTSIMRRLTVLLAVLALGGFALGQEKKGKGLQLKDLPAAVQKTVQANLKGGDIKSIAKEKEDGVEQYEVESVLNGKTRDFNVDSKGALVVMEEGTTVDAIPAAAKAGILKKVGDGKLSMVETFAKPAQPVMYEGSYTAKNGKKHEVLVKADGTETKE
jgi:hypothetical protein